ncbi:CvpA family protein [Immundisolibacter sp.]
MTASLWPIHDRGAVNLIDVLFVLVLVLSLLAGAWRGLMRELLSLLSWLVAAYIAWRFHGLLMGPLEGVIASAGARQAAALLLTFIAAVMVLALLSHLLVSVLKHSPLRGTDRALGAVFGAVRGVVLIAATVLLVEATPLQKSLWWQGSILVPQARAPAQWLRVTVERGLEQFQAPLAG